MAWGLVLVAGLLEIVFAISLKKTDGFTRLVPTLIVIVSGAASFYLLARALQTLPIGVAYAIWTGIGAAGTAIVGMLVLGEARDLAKIVSLVFVLVGLIGLQITTST